PPPAGAGRLGARSQELAVTGSLTRCLVVVASTVVAMNSRTVRVRPTRMWRGGPAGKAIRGRHLDASLTPAGVSSDPGRTRLRSAQSAWTRPVGWPSKRARPRDAATGPTPAGPARTRST